MVKKLLIAVAVIVLLLVGAAVAAPFLIPTDAIMRRVVAEVEARTGRQLSIDGDVSLSLLPVLALDVNQVRFANASWSDAGEMAKVDHMAVELALWPLLSGEVRVARFVLDQPVIRLERRADGTANWQIAAGGETMSGTVQPAAPGTAEPGTAEPGTGAQPGSGNGRLSGLTLGDVHITDGTVIYSDAASGTEQRLDAVNLTIATETLDSPLTLTGDASWRDMPVTISARAETARAVIEGRETPARVELGLRDARVVLDGTALPGGQPGFAGTSEVTVPDPRGLADAMGTPLALPDGALSALSLAGRVDATPARVSLSDARLAVDDIEATGGMAVDLSGPRPKIEGALTTGDLVLDRYLPADAGGGATTPGAGADGAGDQGWSDAPIDLSALAVADADVTINAGSVTIRDTRLGATELALRLDDRRLTVDVPQTGLYGGSGHVTIGVNGRASPASLSLKGAFQGLDLLPLLTAATGSDRLEGTGRTEFDLTARGSSQKALIGGLAGRGLYEVTDGALRGINIAAMIRNLGGAFDDGGAERKTDFARLGGSFTAERGIVTNRDTELQAPLLRVTAAGTVNLPERRLDYRIEPKAVANLEGQGGRADLSGLMVPVIVEGPWSNLSYRPDLEGALRQGLNDPEAVRRAIEGAREGDVGDALKGLLGGGQSGGDAGDDNATDGSEPANPLDQLKGLFKR